MEQIDRHRRKWLSLGGIVLGACALPNAAMAMVSTPKPRLLSFHNVNTGERLVGEYAANGGFNRTLLGKMDYFMRDRRTDQVRRMDPNLFLKFYRIQSALNLRNAEIQVICGYRSAATNAMRHRQSHGVASNSYHIKGQAIDFRINTVPLARLRQAAENLQSGGVGYYPHSNFVHVDTGPNRTWRGV
ncbi:YcbK family protein [uncultured Haemophilus sp.]|uniref:YcbK family protein n=1 Tax=uncultured Haemophilus sp. TaxID=237779 RepID=UPI002804684C|nr:YcbK family protein [uncultured Haemophilus sp.]